MDQVGREVGRTKAVKIAKSSGDGRDREAIGQSSGSSSSPTSLSSKYSVFEEVIKKEIGELRVLVESLLDLTKELGADDTTTTPHKGDGSIVQLPLVLRGGLTKESVALCVGNDLGGVYRVLQVAQEGSAVA